MRLPPPRPRQQGRDFPGTSDLPEGSTFQFSSHQGSCQPTLSHSATHFLERHSPGPLNVLSAVWVWSQTGSRCLVASVWASKIRRPSVRVERRSGCWVKNCGHMIHPDQVFRTSWATSGCLWEQGTDLQGSGCGSAVTWYLVWFTWVCFVMCQTTAGDGPDLKIHFLSCNIFVFFMTLFCMYLHVSRQVQLGQKALLLPGSFCDQQTQSLKPRSAATWRH